MRKPDKLQIEFTMLMFLALGPLGFIVIAEIVRLAACLH